MSFHPFALLIVRMMGAWGVIMVIVQWTGNPIWGSEWWSQHEDNDGGDGDGDGNDEGDGDDDGDSYGDGDANLRVRMMRGVSQATHMPVQSPKPEERKRKGR